MCSWGQDRETFRYHSPELRWCYDGHCSSKDFIVIQLDINCVNWISYINLVCVPHIRVMVSVEVTNKI